MRGVLGVIGGFAALLMLAASAGMNFVFLKSQGRSELEGIVLGVASVSADVLKALLPFFVAWAWRERRFFAAVPGAAMFVFFTVFSLLSALGFAAANRGEVTGSRESVTVTYERAKKDLGELEAQLKGLEKHRPLKVVQEEIAKAKQNRLWSRSQECREATAKDSREYCERYFGLRSELAFAVEGERLTRKRDDLGTEARRLREAGAGTDADPQVTLLSRLLGHEESLVRHALILAAALLVELGSGLGLYLATGHRAFANVEKRGGKTAVCDSTLGEIGLPREIAPCFEGEQGVPHGSSRFGEIEDWCLDRLQPSARGLLVASELFADYVAWCAARGCRPTRRQEFEAVFEAIAHEIGIAKVGVSYSGARLGQAHVEAPSDMSMATLYRASA